MDLEKTIDDMYTLNLLVTGLGIHEEDFINKNIILLNNNAKKVNLLGFWQNDLKDKMKFTMPYKDWNEGFISCRYTVSTIIAEWSEFQSFYKTYGCIAIYDRKLNNIENFKEELQKLKKKLLDDKINIYRIFVFNSIEGENLLYEPEKNIIFIPILAEKKNLISFLSNEIQVMITMIAAQASQEIMKLRTDNHTIMLFNMREEKITDASKLKKRKQGRSLKLMGDLALLFGSYKDASFYYNQAFEILRTNNDLLWCGGIIEGLGCANYLKSIFQDIRDIKIIDQEVIAKIKEAGLKYRQAKYPTFEAESFIKALKILKDFHGKLYNTEGRQRLKTLKYIIKVVRGYVEQPQLGMLQEENYRIQLKVVSIFNELKMYRKAAYFLLNVSRMMIYDNYNIDLVKQLMLSLLTYYYLPDYLEYLPKSDLKNDLMKKIQNKSKNQYFVNKNCRIWPKIQIIALNELLNISSDEPLLKLSIITDLLHYFKEELGTVYQAQLLSQISQEGSILPKNIKLNMSFLPEIIKITPILLESKFTLLKVNSISDDGNDQNINNLSLGSKANKPVFICEPWKKTGGILNWTVGIDCSVKITLKNIMRYEIPIDMIILVTEGVPVTTYPSSITIPPLSFLEFFLKIKPMKSGTLSITGIITKISNISYYHQIGQKGFLLDNPMNENKKISTNLKNIQIMDNIPIAELRFKEKNDVIEIIEKGDFSICGEIINCNDQILSIRKLVIKFDYVSKNKLAFELDILKEENAKLLAFESLQIHLIHNTSNETFDKPKNIIHVDLIQSNVPDLNDLNKIMIKIGYSLENDVTLIREDYISKDVKVIPSFEIKNLMIHDNVKNDCIKIGRRNYQVCSLNPDFYLSFDIWKPNNTLKLIIDFYEKNSKKHINKTIINENDSLTRIIFKLGKQFLPNESQDLDAILYYKWYSDNFNYHGTSNFENLLDIFQLQICKKPKNAIRKRKGKYLLLFGLPMYTLNVSFKKMDMRYTVGEIIDIMVNIELDLVWNKSKIRLLTLILEKDELQGDIDQIASKYVKIIGKRSIRWQFNEDNRILDENITAMITKNGNYHVYVMIIEKEFLQIYFHKYVNMIVVI